MNCAECPLEEGDERSGGVCKGSTCWKKRGWVWGSFPRYHAMQSRGSGRRI